MTKARRSLLVVTYILFWALATSAGQTFEKKVSQLLRDEPEKIKCFAERMRDFTCFWEEEESRNASLDPYTFTYTYQYQNENSSICPVRELPVLSAKGKRLFLCELPRIEFFVQVHMCVIQGGREVYNRSLFIDQTFLLDPPANVTVRTTGQQGQLNVTWLPPHLKYMGDSMMYEVRYVMEGSPMRKEILKASTKLTLRGLQPSSKYTVWVRVKPDGITYNGYWSAWSDPVFGTTAPSDLDPLIVVLVLIISLIFILLSLTVLLSHHKFLLKKLWPDIPSPEHKFSGLFTVYKGDFQEWLGQSNSITQPIHMYSEELPSPLEVLSEASLATSPTNHASPPKLGVTPRAAPFLKEESEATEEEREDHLPTKGVDEGVLDRWQEPPNTHWLMEQLRVLQEHPEAQPQSFLESQDTYVILNQNSQNIREVDRGQGDDVLEESLPLQALFASRDLSLSAASHSDLGSLQQSSGSGRLSSQSSFEYPNHTWPPKGPGYTYMAVADSGVSMDYSPMSTSRIMDRGTVYANEYKNDILGHRRPISCLPIHS